MNPVDDALMGITHVLRGEDLLPSTPRQIALYRALLDVGVDDRHPALRAPAARARRGQQEALQARPRGRPVPAPRPAGFIPEGLLNYLALLGWSIGPDRDIFSLRRVGRRVRHRDVNPNPARFDQKKAEAINGDHIRMLAPDDFARRASCPTCTRRPVLVDAYADLAGAAGAARRGRAAGAGAHARCWARRRACSASCSSPTTRSTTTTTPAARCATNAGEVLDAAVGALERCSTEFTTAAIAGGAAGRARRGPRAQAAVRVHGPLRVALSGRRISPPLFESMEILGKESIARADRAPCAPSL